MIMGGGGKGGGGKGACKFDGVERPELVMTAVKLRRWGEDFILEFDAIGGVDVGLVDTRIEGTVGTRDCIDVASAAVSGCSSARVSSSENGVSACKAEARPGCENLGGGGNGCGKGVADREDGDFAEMTSVKLVKFSLSTASSWTLGTISFRNSISSEDRASDRDELDEAVDERENRPKKRDTADGAVCCAGSCANFCSVSCDETEGRTPGLAWDGNVLADERVDG